jgi:hypothetical protein
MVRRGTVEEYRLKKHLTHAMAKTGSTSRTQLAVRWRRRVPCEGMHHGRSASLMA